MPAAPDRVPSSAGTDDRPVVVIGDVMTDVMTAVDDPMALGSDTPAQVTTRQGGAGANVAHWLAQLGVPTAFIGSVGRDPFGREAVEVLRSAGVDVRVTEAALPTGTRVILVDRAGGRTMLPDAGANSSLSPEALPVDLLQSARWLHLSGYTLLNPGSRETGLAALQVARAAGVPTSVDAASAAPLQSVGAKEFLQLTDGVDLALCTLDEAEVLCDSREPTVVAARLTASYPQLVLKLGPEGAMWCSAQDVGGCRVAAAPARGPVVDTSGAGDAFSAAYLAAASSLAFRTSPASGRSSLVPPTDAVRRALTAACALAASVVTRPGSRPD
jgi:sugar/nucleoside kinase (ribokinase family)